MATQPPANQLPLFYNSLAPLSSQLHPSHGLKPRPDLGFTRGTHAIPVTVDEFPLVQRNYPIVFGVGENPAPLALVGLQEGENLFLGADDQWEAGAYVPAFVRRYPFMLARLTPDAQELSLCFDDSAGIVVENDGTPLFAGTDPSDITKAVLQFCEQFEQAVMRTRGFMDELAKLDLLMDGEVSIQRDGLDQPAVYRGFRMVDEQKLQNLRGDQARKMVQSGMMGLVYAHLFSLSLISPLFERQFAATTAKAA
ncbi:MAG: SapC family protein [Alphaproteobacteria bacterium]|nr:SapC family protein [Alphaproteobacteria bacterium]